jgi:hypothetical protein
MPPEETHPASEIIALGKIGQIVSNCSREEIISQFKAVLKDMSDDDIKKPLIAYVAMFEYMTQVWELQNPSIAPSHSFTVPDEHLIACQSNQQAIPARSEWTFDQFLNSELSKNPKVPTVFAVTMALKYVNMDMNDFVTWLGMFRYSSEEEAMIELCKRFHI